MFDQDVCDGSNVRTSTGGPMPSPTPDSLLRTTAGAGAPSNLLDVRDSTSGIESSPSGGSSAENWFNSCNSNVQNAHRAEFVDSTRPGPHVLAATRTNDVLLDDPPYYVDWTRRYGRPSDYTENAPPDQSAAVGDNPTEGGMSGLSVQHASGDGTEEFRSVIDDLTIENKELRRRLRRLETLHCSHLEADKLFEVKMHGLPLNKKRELEGILRGFAVDLRQSPAQLDCPPASRESSPTPDNQFQDSGYTSHSASSHNLPRSHSKYSASTATKEQKISAYADSVGGRAHARHAPSVSEKAKMKPVVRRLEQLFTGGRATGTPLEKSLQQQIAVQSVARLGGELESSGEGIREACLCTADTDALDDPITNSRDSLARPSASATLLGGGAREQRPTHPLDLDLDRVRCPAENIDYIRHLGACSPKQNGETTPRQDEEGWIYLNVLTNMAQLHTINVTPEFVRKAITNLSDKLELSEDGRKIRWKGGNEGTNLTSDSGGISSGERGSPNSPDEGSRICGDGVKRRKLGNGLYEQGGSGGGSRPEYVTTLAPKKRRKSLVDLDLTLRYPFRGDTLHYEPLFFHSGAHGKECRYPSTNNSDPAYSPHPAGTSAQGAQRDGRIRSLKRRREDGPIIFFNGTDFCTDLSGDGTDPLSSYPSTLSTGRDACTQYDKTVLGCPRTPVVRTVSGSAEFSHPLTETQPADSEEELSDAGSDKALADNITALSNFAFSPQRTASDEENIPVVELEASGIGGVQPSDNFAINVSLIVTRNNLPCSDTNLSVSSSRVQRIVHRILETSTSRPGACNLPRERYDPPIRHDVISATRVDLPPFQVPPTYFFRPSSSDEDYEDYSSDSTESGAMAVDSSSQSSCNRRSYLAEEFASGKDEVSSLSFIHPWYAYADARGKNEGIGIRSLSAATEGSDGSGYESGDDDMS